MSGCISSFIREGQSPDHDFKKKKLHFSLMIQTQTVPVVNCNGSFSLLFNSEKQDKFSERNKKKIGVITANKNFNKKLVDVRAHAA